ncbi:MAG: toxin-antitoxin system protein [Oscillibacter sp.]
MDEKPLKIKVSLSLDEDIVLQLRSIATEDDRALSSYINLVLRDHLRKRNEKQ